MKLLLPLLLCFGLFSALQITPEYNNNTPRPQDSEFFQLKQAVEDVNDQMVGQEGIESNEGFGTVLEISLVNSETQGISKGKDDRKAESFAQEIQLEGKNFMDEESQPQNNEQPISTFEEPAQQEIQTQVESTQTQVETTSENMETTTTQQNVENAVPEYPTQMSQEETVQSSNTDSIEYPTQQINDVYSNFYNDNYQTQPEVQTSVEMETQTVSSETQSTSSVDNIQSSEQQVAAYPEQPLNQEVPTSQPTQMDNETVISDQASYPTEQMSNQESPSAGIEENSQMNSEQSFQEAPAIQTPAPAAYPTEMAAETIASEATNTESVAPEAQDFQSAQYQNQDTQTTEMQAETVASDYSTTTQAQPDQINTEVAQSTDMSVEPVATDATQQIQDVGADNYSPVQQEQPSTQSTDSQGEAVSVDPELMPSNQEIAVQPTENIEQMNTEPVASDSVSDSQVPSYEQGIANAPIQEVPAVQSTDMFSEPVQTDTTTQVSNTQENTQMNNESTDQQNQGVNISTEEQTPSFATEAPATQPTDMFAEPVQTVKSSENTNNNEQPANVQSENAPGVQASDLFSEPISTETNQAAPAPIDNTFDNQSSEMSAEPTETKVESSGMQTIDQNDSGMFVANEGEMGAEPVESADSPLEAKGDCLIVYSQCKYEGESMKICGNVSEMKDFQHDIHSIYVPKGQSISIYQEADFKGDADTFTQSQECLVKPVLLTQVAKQTPKLTNQNLRIAKN